jgi:Xaa-Pro aminopeptidase
MKLRVLLLVPALLLVSQIGRSQSDLDDPLDAAFRVSRRANLGNNLEPESCAVIFSGGFDEFSPGGALPRPFTPNPDFFYLTGLRIPDAVLVIFSASRSLSEGQSSEILFLPGPNDQVLKYMGESWASEFGKQASGYITRPSTQWRRFCVEVLGGDSITKVLSSPFDHADYRKPGDLAYMDMGSILYSNLFPGFPFNPPAQRLYHEIALADTVALSQLVARVSAYLDYFPGERRDPILDAFTRVQDQAGLAEVQAKVAKIKIDLVRLPEIMEAMRKRKIASERKLISDACQVLTRGMQAAAGGIQPGREEYALQAASEQVVIKNGARLAMPSRVASGSRSALPYYTRNSEKVPESGFVVLDFAARLEGYCGRITRTFPASGKFSVPEAQMYTLLLNIHQAVLAECKPGSRPSNVINTARPGFEAFFDKMALASNKAGRSKIIQSINLAPIGLDLNELPLPDALLPGMVFELETAIYIPSDSRINATWHNTGIVLRDVIEITGDGPKVLTGAFGSSIADIEAACQAKSKFPHND